MSAQLPVSSAAFLIADPARAIMLNALLDGRALPAGELAYAAGITAQTASAHLAKLVDGGLLAVEAEGRHRYFRLADGQVAHALESLAAITQGIGPDGQPRRKPMSAEARKIRLARRCYDHLAGRLGVAVARALQEGGYLAAAPDKRFEVTPAGVAWFGRMGLEVEGAAPSGRREALRARQCLDWTERQHHLGGPLGVAFMQLLCDKGWLKRSDETRAMRVTPAGWAGLERELGVQQAALAV